MIPDFATKACGDTIFINLWLPIQRNYVSKGNEINLEIETAFPTSGKNRLKLTRSNPGNQVLALRIPGWAEGRYKFISGNDTVSPPVCAGYAYVDAGGVKSLEIEADFNLQSKLNELNGMQAITLGPISFARDNRYNDGDVDECGVIETDPEGNVAARLVMVPDKFSWLTLEVPMVSGTDLEDSENRKARYVKFCDFGSAGNDWAKDGRYRVWITRPIHAMSQPYRKY